ncbi:MAG: hypothetical protein ACRELB_18390 [Polyangiaceae bacterium]
MSFSDGSYKAWITQLAAAVARIPRPKLRALIQKALVPIYPASDEAPFAVRNPTRGFFAKIYPGGVEDWLEELAAAPPCSASSRRARSCDTNE